MLCCQKRAPYTAKSVGKGQRAPARRQRRQHRSSSSRHGWDAGVSGWHGSADKTCDPRDAAGRPSRSHARSGVILRCAARRDGTGPGRGPCRAPAAAALAGPAHRTPRQTRACGGVRGRSGACFGSGCASCGVVESRGRHAGWWASCLVRREAAAGSRALPARYGGRRSAEGRRDEANGRQ